jgi:hypothetical protein
MALARHVFADRVDSSRDVGFLKVSLVVRIERLDLRQPNGGTAMFSFKDLLSFEKFITPTIIKLVYIVGIVLIVIGGLVGFFGAFAASGFGAALVTLIGALAGLLAWRVYCELVMVFFGLYDRAGEIRDRLPAR